jgi:uncharacterized protein YciI
VPFFIFRGTDGPGGASIRAEIRDAHRAYIRVATPGCRVVAGGPLVDDHGNVMFGTLLVLEAIDRNAAQQFLQGDPYAKAQLFAHTELDRWQWGLGDLIKPT